MKLVNCKVGTKVEVKPLQDDEVLIFYPDNERKIGTVVSANTCGEVRVLFDHDGSTDSGHHTNLRKYKGETA